RRTLFMIDTKLRYKQFITMIILIILVVFACAWSMTSGEYKMSIGTFFKTLIGQDEYTDTLILIEFIFPRMVITILADSALAMSGAIIQSVTKNPLEEPGILGINAGSEFAIALFIVVGQVNADNFVYVLPIISMIGG